MGETAAVLHYMNPLTLEAQFFLSSIEKLTKTYKQIDTTLCSTLYAVVDAIDTFLAQRPVLIVETETTQFVKIDELAAIDRIYQCKDCKQQLGQADKAAFHLSENHLASKKNQLRKQRRKLEREKRATMVHKLPKKAKSLFSADLDKFFADHIVIAEKLKNIPEYQTIEKELLDAIQPQFPGENVRLFKFGSRINGIGTRNSDLDIFVEIGNTSSKFENRASRRTLSNLQNVCKVLRGTNTWTQVLCIDKARVPILKVYNRSTGIDCDIGFSNSLGFFNSKVMEYMYELQPIARRMCIFMKTWLDRSKIRDLMSTYAISLLVLFYLQMQNLLPAVELLQSDDDEKVTVGPWIASFKLKPLSDFKMEKMEVTSANTEKMLLEFFVFYANFNYKQNVISPYLGRIAQTIDIEAEMPPRYTKYVLENAGRDCMLQLSKEMVVQDPLQLNHNVTKSVTQYQLKILIDFLSESAVSIKDE